MVNRNTGYRAIYRNNNEYTRGIRKLARKHKITIVAAYVLENLANGSAGHCRRFAVDCDLFDSQAKRAAELLASKGLAVTDRRVPKESRGEFFGCSKKGLNELHAAYGY